MKIVIYEANPKGLWQPYDVVDGVTMNQAKAMVKDLELKRGRHYWWQPIFD